MPSAEVPGIFPKLIISPYSDRVPRISLFMEAAHWSCTTESVVMMRTHNADSGFCYTFSDIGEILGKILVTARQRLRISEPSNPSIPSDTIADNSPRCIKSFSKDKTCC